MTRLLDRQEAKKILNNHYAGRNTIVIDILDILFPPIAVIGEVIAVWFKKEDEENPCYRKYIEMRNDMFMCISERKSDCEEVPWKFARPLNDEERQVLQ